MGVFGMFIVMQGRRLFYSVFAITVRRDMACNNNNNNVYLKSNIQTSSIDYTYKLMRYEQIKNTMLMCR